MACNFIVHANDILLYQLPDKEIKKEADDAKYFEGIITITTSNKQKKMTTTKLDFPLFAKTCIMLSESVKE